MLSRFVRPSPFVAALALLAGLGSALSATMAAADEGLYLTWSECAAPGSGATANRNSGCAVSLGENPLYCAFILPAPLDSVIGLEVVVDIQHSLATMPPWWELQPTGCRANALVVSGDFQLDAWCVDPWTGGASAGLQGYLIGEPRGGANQARIKAVVGVPAVQARSLNATDMYYGVKLVIRNDKTAGTGACAGCLSPACLVLNSILVRRVSGGDVFLQTPGPGNANWATWQGGGGASCLLVPVRSRTWGQVKSLYR